ncbi:PREDICTED: secretory carrier-associated membrane protein 1-like isoform X1 [Branchiostoma belcheri]|uniref:Secretory carrier-associated membrane protein n=1 Tax=Branchiostoma belcheri TaxID=7741 RepID=A0A6P4XXT8_BRABE|nr:PREDICTED: secretory carrier-associated membrane protein 1-like isoform X1 [Branchiostoma belcheri]
MSDYDSNPFADPEAGNPFQDPSVTQVTGAAQQTFTEEFNPFAEQGRTTAAAGKTNPVVPPPQKPQPAQQPAVMRPTEEPPAYSPSAAQQAQGPAVPTNEDLIKRQEELERKAAELQRKEREMAAGTYNARANNWPPLPSWCPVGPCFYQDISVDIPLEFQRTVKMMYYLWMFHVVTLLLNVLMMVAYVAAVGVDLTAGIGLGMAILFTLLFPACSFCCWFRPLYKAFRSDSSFNFFVFFFIFFFQFVVHVIQAVGIGGWGTCGWINGITAVTVNPGVGAIMLIIAAFFTISAVLSIIFLKKVHSLYRTTGASFEKAQAEFTEGVVSNRGVQQAAGQFGAAAAKGAARGAMSSASGNQM